MVGFCHGGNVLGNHDYDDDNQTGSTQVLVQEVAGAFSAGEWFTSAFNTERPPEEKWLDCCKHHTGDFQQHQT